MGRKGTRPGPASWTRGRPGPPYPHADPRPARDSSLRTSRPPRRPPRPSATSPPVPQEAVPMRALKRPLLGSRARFALCRCATLVNPSSSSRRRTRFRPTCARPHPPRSAWPSPAESTPRKASRSDRSAPSARATSPRPAPGSSVRGALGPSASGVSLGRTWPATKAAAGSATVREARLLRDPRATRASGRPLA